MKQFKFKHSNFQIKLSIILLLFFWMQYAWGQRNASSNAVEVPEILPPSPTVASLMKFEEIPVNNYTGIPNISIPLFSTNTNSNINISLSLDYHPSSIAIDEIAPYTGLGWSLIGGGTVSRTVKGVPDEYYHWSSTPFTASKIGIYHKGNGSGNSSDHTNYYYKAEQYIEDASTSQDPKLFKYKFETHEKGLFDTQHDLYQYNIMGISGRFIIKKNQTTEELYIERLDDNFQYKIILDYSFNNNLYTINGFTIIDEHGNQYILDVKERNLRTGSFSDYDPFDGSGPIFTNPINSTNSPYPTAFHLRYIYDHKNNLIASFEYDTFKEIVTTSTTTYNETGISKQSIETFGDGVKAFNLSQIEPLRILSVNNQEIETKKLSSIFIENKSKIYFTTIGGRGDSNIGGSHPDNNHRKLATVEIKTWENNLIKKFEFDYDYFSVPYPSFTTHKRLILKNVKELDSLQNQIHNYDLFYKTLQFPGYDKEIIKNPWGYFEISPKFQIGYGRKEEKDFATLGVLNKMTLPTGGYIEFDYEPNTYSYEGKNSIPTTEYDENPENFYVNGEDISLNFLLDSTFGEFNLLSNSEGNDGFEIRIDLDEFDINDFNGDYSMGIHSIPEGDVEQVCKNINNLTMRFCKVKMEPDKSYVLRITDMGHNHNETKNIPVYITKYKKVDNSELKKYVYGGGIRIKNVSFYENDSKSLQTEYLYSEFNDSNKSSSSLVFPKPIFEYEIQKNTDFLAGSSEYHYHTQSNVGYRTKTSFNNLSFLRTQGSDVGYKNVTISKVNVDDQSKNGKTQYTYLSPLDFPEKDSYDEEDISYSIVYPFVPTINLDYKRGLLVKSATFNNENDTLQVNINKYDFVNNKKTLSGIVLANNGGGNPFAYVYNNFQEYQAMFTACGYDWTPPPTCTNNPNPGGPLHINCSLRESAPTHNISIFGVYEASGWAQLSESITKEYFYTGNSQNVVETTQTFTYNDFNKQIKTQTVKNSLGEEIKTEYIYPQDGIHWQAGIMNQMIARNMISTPVIVKSSNDGIPVSEQMTEYQIVNTDQILPQYVYVKKGSHSPENKITYDHYDEKGNLTEYTLADGTPVSIIWGYNKQYPVAKVEGVRNNQITNHILTLESLSNNGTLIPGSFESLRNFNGALVTCYIYEPLVGVTTIIQANGQKETYEYDTAGRLMHIKDHNGNVLKKIEYNYAN